MSSGPSSPAPRPADRDDGPARTPADPAAAPGGETHGEPVTAPPTDHSFPGTSRLKNRGQFDVVFQQGRKVVNRSLVVWIHPSPAGITAPRLGLAVGKRLGGAPARNRIKRLLRVAFRMLSAARPAPVDMVIVPRAADPPRTAAEATAGLADILATYDRQSARPDRRPPRSRRPGDQGRRR